MTPADSPFAAGPAPDLSAVVVVPRRFASVARTVAALRAQTLAGRIELVVVAPDRAAVADEVAALDGFAATTVVPVGAVVNADQSAVAGLLAARAPIVASLEDHAFPEPDWAEAVLREWALAGPDCAAIGCVIANANPRSPWSRCNILLGYRAWSEDVPGGPIDWVPPHNVTFRRAALEPLGAALAPLVGREGDMQRALLARGGRFRFAAGARIRHLNPSALGATARLRFDAGRVYAARRASEYRWSWPRRLAYAALGPLIPVVRYARLRDEVFGGGRRQREAELGPALLATLAFDGAGQVLGYLAGAGDAEARLAVVDMDRLGQLDAPDRARFAAG